MMPSFDIVIVGAGLVGLAAAIGLRRRGHTVHVVEAIPSLSVFGDSIAVAANQARVLEHYGILDDFRKRAVKDVGLLRHRRYDTGEVLATRDMETHEADYGYASYIVSRKGYQGFLYEHAEKLGVEFRFDCRVDRIDDSTSRPAVIFKDGSRIGADIIVGADGVKSAVRRSIHSSVELNSRFYCCRATIPHEKCRADPELSPLLTGFNIFLGPQRLVIQSNMMDVGVVSLNFHHVGDAGGPADWKAPGDPDRLRAVFKDFGPPIRKMVDMVDQCTLWKVAEVPSLPSWVSDGGKIVLIGDAAHGMSPYQGQGCAMGVEDGGTLAECLNHANTLNDVPALLKTFESLRKPRAELLGTVSTTLGNEYMMPDGEQQRRRDDKLRKSPMWAKGDWDGGHIDDLPSSGEDPKYSPWVMAYDAIEFANRHFRAL